jgi:hypothetical protein
MASMAADIAIDNKNINFIYLLVAVSVIFVIGSFMENFILLQLLQLAVLSVILFFIVYSFCLVGVRRNFRK